MLLFGIQKKVIISIMCTSITSVVVLYINVTSVVSHVVMVPCMY